MALHKPWWSLSDSSDAEDSWDAEAIDGQMTLMAMYEHFEVPACYEVSACEPDAPEELEELHGFTCWGTAPHRAEKRRAVRSASQRRVYGRWRERCKERTKRARREQGRWKLRWQLDAGKAGLACREGSASSAMYDSTRSPGSQRLLRRVRGWGAPPELREVRRLERVLRKCMKTVSAAWKPKLRLRAMVAAWRALMLETQLDEAKDALQGERECRSLLRERWLEATHALAAEQHRHCLIQSDATKQLLRTMVVAWRALMLEKQLEEERDCCCQIKSEAEQHKRRADHALRAERKWRHLCEKGQSEATEHKRMICLLQAERSQLQEQFEELTCALEAEQDKCFLIQAEAEESNRLKVEEITRLERQLCVQKLQLRVIVAGTRFGEMWQFRGSADWHDFSARTSCEVMEAWCSKSKAVTIVVAGQPYTIHLDEPSQASPQMYQINCTTGTKRPIRCTFGLPSHWSRQDSHWLAALRSSGSWSPASPTDVISEINNASHTKALLDCLRGSCRHATPLPSGVPGCRNDFGLRRLVRVENLLLWARYCAFKADLQNKLNINGCESAAHLFGPELLEFSQELQLDDRVNEFALFHGTTEKRLLHIMSEGFDPQVARRGHYGRGTYFASQACKSLQYCTSSPRVMIVSRVLLGSVHLMTRVDAELGRPPYRPGGKLLHDSVAAQPGPMQGHQNSMQTHSEFVIFDRRQIYPEMVLYL